MNEDTLQNPIPDLYHGVQYVFRNAKHPFTPIKQTKVDIYIPQLKIAICWHPTLEKHDLERHERLIEEGFTPILITTPRHRATHKKTIWHLESMDDPESHLLSELFAFISNHHHLSPIKKKKMHHVLTLKSS